MVKSETKGKEQMHYSEKLKMELEEEKKKVKALKDGYQDIRAYLNLPKYGMDVMVNKNDILSRINEILYNISWQIRKPSWYKSQEGLIIFRT